MRPEVSTVLVSLAVAALPMLALCMGTMASTDADDGTTSDPCSVRWSRPTDGLSLGIEVPESPLIFVPVEGWQGPVLQQETDSEGSFIGLKPNPGGHWEDSAVLKVHLQNDSPHVVFWSRDRDVWHILFEGPTFIAPPAWLYPKPPPDRQGPIRLAPGEQAHMSLDISGAFNLWPLVEPGDYTIQVIYSPDQLLTFATGSEGRYTHPYDVPGFQKGTFATPAITVEARHPWLNDADIRARIDSFGGGKKAVDGGWDIWLRRVKDEDLRFLSRIPNFKELSIHESYVTDAGLRHLALLKDLEGLHLVLAPRIADEGLVHLRELTNLESLSLRETKIQGPGLRCLLPLKNLTSLRLDNSPVTDEGMTFLAELTALHTLSLWGTRVTDDGLRHLRMLPHLEQLNLWCAGVSDAGVRYLVGMNLRGLSLSGITDGGLAYVKQLDQLEDLDLALSQVTDEGIEHLRTMKTLRRLNFEGGGPPQAGITQLRQSLPQTKITGP